MAKRTLNEIEKDFKRIRTVVDTTPVTSIKEIAKAVGLTESEVKTSLSKHPRIEEKILAQLEKNKEAKKKAEHEANLKKPLKSKKNEKTEASVDFDAGFVIDASITGTE